MKNLKNKLINFGIGLGIVGLSFLPINSFGQSSSKTFRQDSLKNKQQVQTKQESKKWDGSFGFGTIMPHDEILKDAFGSYWAFNAEARARIAKGKDFYLGPSLIYMWDKAKENSDEVRVSGLEFSGLISYQIENFSIGAGPTISTLNVSENWKESGLEHNLSENYSGLGATLDMKYSLPVGNNFNIVFFGRYTYMKKDEDKFPETLGTTRLGVGLEL